MNQKIVLKIKDEELVLIKNLLKALKESTKTMEISSFRYGTLGDDNLVSFNVDGDNVDLVVENLLSNGIKILQPDQEKRKSSKVIVNDLTASQRYNQDEDRKQASRESPSLQLEAALKNGDYETVIKLSKDFRNGFEVINKAKENIDAAILKAIDNAYDKGLKSRFEVDSSVDILMKVAGDKNLKAFNKIGIQKTAGLKAVTLCEGNIDQTNNLIRICNNSLIPSITCLKSAAAFARIIEKYPQKAEEELTVASKNLNIRWLRIALDMTGPELPKEETDMILNLIEALQSKQ